MLQPALGLVPKSTNNALPVVSSAERTQGPELSCSWLRSAPERTFRPFAQLVVGHQNLPRWTSLFPGPAPPNLRALSSFSSSYLSRCFWQAWSGFVCTPMASILIWYFFFRKKLEPVLERPRMVPIFLWKPLFVKLPRIDCGSIQFLLHDCYSDAGFSVLQKW